MGESVKKCFITILTLKVTYQNACALITLIKIPFACASVISNSRNFFVIVMLIILDILFIFTCKCWTISRESQIASSSCSHFHILLRLFVRFVIFDVNNGVGMEMRLSHTSTLKLSHQWRIKKRITHEITARKKESTQHYIAKVKQAKNKNPTVFERKNVS